MKQRAGWIASGFLVLICLFSGSLPGEATKVTVMNPRGIKPQIRRVPMADRAAALKGKTIYLVDTRFPRTREFVEALFDGLKAKYPETDWVLRDKYGGYMDDDPKLWAEIKEKGHGMVMTVGH